ncbi:DNA-binding transcriptional regulator YbjK [Actinokineospora alba]|uniref:DNA-binding transcriptional regulator YbjK n=1 Tax=Actinokineospora alba TaxID=504798 RepID=A0A1H0ND64_9PSEU|nr:TetR family transcriptional regulator [Actinokineospora alba]TDP68669.1 TetR family transcriptional regulator [Actinokineospora alba]SDH84091.1 DNA-binding transcriptional regulator YbjK [Actinokineospora alba]SDO90335.1 DNA-binding transcriptional regulator YbjK [Actinokineospora alba]
MEEPITDGRRVKGERRKQELIEATLRVVAREGVAGVSHRTVAREADLPATAAAYHFHGIDDLLAAALTRSMDDDAARMRRFAADTGGGADGLRELAERMAEVVAEPDHLLAEYELYLLAAREPKLRPATHRWMDAVAEFARRYTDDSVRIQILVGVVDGLLLQGLLHDRPPTADQLEAVLRTVLVEPAFAAD